MKFFTTLSALSTLIFFFCAKSLPGQDLDEKINGIEGKINEIKIYTEEGEHTFEGDDAEKLFEKMKSSPENFFLHSSGKNGKEKIVYLDTDSEKYRMKIMGDEEEEIIIISEDIDDDMERMHKKVKIEVEDGNKKVTVTTRENGDEKTEVYEGDEAEEYIKKMDENINVDLEISIEKDSDKKNVKKKKIILEKKIEKKSE